jgi:cytochrome o ubiquinol oxidase operon protein cyoD
MSHHHAEHGDSGPGMDFDEPGDLGAGFRSYVIGFLLASGLTAISFLLPLTGLVWGPALPMALIVFAIAQMGIHLVFFLHITTSPDNTNNVLALAFGVLMVFLVIGGSVWIMSHLNENMMPMDKMMQMQR